MRQSRSDSAESAIKRKANLNATINPPGSLELKNEDERTLWNQLTSARDIAAWREVDLVLLHKCMRIEMDVRTNREEMGDDWMVDGKPNEQLKIIDTLEKQFLNILRVLSLGVHAADAKALNSGGVKAKEKADHNSRNKSNVVELLA